MLKFIVLCILLFYSQNAYSECCPSAFGGGYLTCKDGTTTHTCCGAGKSSGWYSFGGCNFACCDCRGGCRKTHNLKECLAWSKGLCQVCQNGCVDLQDPTDCDAACKREQDGRDSKCYSDWD